MENKATNVQAGERLRMVRKTNLLSQHEMADILSCSQARVYYLETGKLSMYGEELINLLEKLSVNPMFILGFSKTVYLTKFQQINNEETTNINPSPKREMTTLAVSKKGAHTRNKKSKNEGDKKP